MSKPGGQFAELCLNIGLCRRAILFERSFGSRATWCIPNWVGPGCGSGNICGSYRTPADAVCLGARQQHVNVIACGLCLFHSHVEIGWRRARPARQSAAPRRPHIYIIVKIPHVIFHRSATTVGSGICGKAFRAACERKMVTLHTM